MVKDNAKFLIFISLAISIAFLSLLVKKFKSIFLLDILTPLLFSSFPEEVVLRMMFFLLILITLAFKLNQIQYLKNHFFSSFLNTSGG